MRFLCYTANIFCDSAQGREDVNALISHFPAHWISHSLQSLRYIPKGCLGVTLTHSFNPGMSWVFGAAGFKMRTTGNQFSYRRRGRLTQCVSLPVSVSGVCSLRCVFKRLFLYTLLEVFCRMFFSMRTSSLENLSLASAPGEE